MKTISLLIFSISLLAGCTAQSSGVSGSMNTWIKGKSLSVQAFYMNPGKSTMPTVSLRNDSDKAFSITPVTVTAWFKQAGEKQKTLNSGNMSGNGRISPQQEIMLTDELLKFDVAPSDQLDKLRLSVGEAGSTQEIFTINR